MQGYAAKLRCRNLGVLFALMFFMCSIYLLATEFISAKKSKGEVLLFPRGAVPDLVSRVDAEANADDRVTTQTITQIGRAHV